MLRAEKPIVERELSRVSSEATQLEKADCSSKWMKQNAKTLVVLRGVAFTVTVSVYKHTQRQTVLTNLTLQCIEGLHTKGRGALNP